MKQIVFISAYGVNHNEQAPLRIVEHMVIESGVPYTILRPNFFSENFSDGPQAGTIQGQNAIFLAAADGKTSFVSVRDIAAVAVVTSACFAAVAAVLDPEALRTLIGRRTVSDG